MSEDMHEPPPYPAKSLEWIEVCRCACHGCCIPLDQYCDDCEDNHDEL